MKRYILTGTPGAGKTSILHGLAALGYPVVEEAATAVIAAAQVRGDTEPWTRPSFITDILRVQRHLPEVPAGVVVHDRSPVCTHALAVHLGFPVTRELAAEVARSAAVYQRRVFFVRNLGFCEPTPARRIGFAEALEFERLPHAADAIAVRRWDDAAKDPAAVPPPFARFLPVLNRVRRSRMDGP